MYLHAVSILIQCDDKRRHTSIWPSWYKNLMVRSARGRGWDRGRCQAVAVAESQGEGNEFVNS